MGNAKRRQQRRSDNEHAKVQMAGHKLVLERCGPGWSRAYEELRSMDVRFEEFAADKFDCRECPLFVECLTKNHFNNNQNWRFAWYEEQFGTFLADETQVTADHRKDTHDGSHPQP